MYVYMRVYLYVCIYMYVYVCIICKGVCIYGLQIAKNNTKLLFFCNILVKIVKITGFLLFFAFRLQKTPQNHRVLQSFAENIENQRFSLIFLHSDCKKHYKTGVFPHPVRSGGVARFLCRALFLLLLLLLLTLRFIRPIKTTDINDRHKRHKNDRYIDSYKRQV